MANHTPSTTKKNVPSTTRKFLAAGGLALSLGMFASAGTALPGLGRRTRLGRRPRLGVLAGAPGLGSHPADPSWPGISSQPCCSR